MSTAFKQCEIAKKKFQKIKERNLTYGRNEDRLA